MGSSRLAAGTAPGIASWERLTGKAEPGVKGGENLQQDKEENREKMKNQERGENQERSVWLQD